MGNKINKNYEILGDRSIKLLRDLTKHHGEDVNSKNKCKAPCRF